MNIIPICPQTLDIIEVLNDGVRPEIQEEDTFYIWSKTPGVKAGIMTKDEIADFRDWWSVIRLLHFDMEPQLTIVPE